MWRSRTKRDLIIEVWEKLDCESVGAAEIEAIEEAVSARFGPAAVESPMRIARMLADEGAVLRHPEIMSLWVRHSAAAIAESSLADNLLRFDSFADAAASLRSAENLRRRFAAEGNRDRIRKLRSDVIRAKSELLEASREKRRKVEDRRIKTEIAEWLTIWLQSPEVFENWVRLRQSSDEFRKMFGDT